METAKALCSATEAILPPAVRLAVLLLGLVWLLLACGRALLAIYRATLRPAKRLSRYGEWAVVTGATDGIGRAMAEELARSGMRLVLLSRTQEKLEKLAEELPTESRCVAVDFASANENDWDRVAKAIEDVEVGVLINNVGMSYPHAMYLNEVSVELETALLRVNVVSCLRMCRIVIPGMLKRRRGAIVNIGSAAGTVLPSDPLYSIYAGSKSFVDGFSRSLHTELKPFGIDVQLQAPLYVATKMAKIRRPSTTVPSPDQYARAAVREIGYEPRTTPFFVHKLMWWFITLLPEFVVDSVRRDMCVSIRKRAIAKKHRQEAEAKKQ